MTDDTTTQREEDQGRSKILCFHVLYFNFVCYLLPWASGQLVIRMVLGSAQSFIFYRTLIMQ